MALINFLTEGNVNNLLEVCYRSEEIPFLNVTEMIVIFSAVYYDENQGFKVKETFRKLKYDSADKSINIH
jgi:hypothetical protein